VQVTPQLRNKREPDTNLMESPKPPTNPRFVVMGGLAESLIKFRQPLLEELLANGYQVHTIAGESDPLTAEKLEKLGVPFHPIALKRTGLNPLVDGNSSWQIAKLLRRIKPDAMLAYTAKPVIFGLLAARLCRVRNRYAMITGLGFALIGETKKRLLLKKLTLLLYRIALHNSRAVFFQNIDDELLFRREVLQSKTPTFILRGSGVNSQYFSSAELPDNPPTKFLFIGRILAEKGVRELAEAARVLLSFNPGKVEFHTVGWVDASPTGITQSEFDEWVSEGLFIHHGRVEDVRPFIAASHVLVLPSYREGTSRSVLEAMSMQRAIVSTDAPGCREPVVANTTGLLVPIKDSAALAKALQRFIDEPNLINQFGTAGQARITELYEAAAVAQVAVRSIQQTRIA
jgi:glycosyltransferase involved in cell wall biosynthesis